MKFSFFVMFFFFAFSSQAQKPEFATSFIPEALKENANAVVRLSRIDVNIVSRNSMQIHEYRIVSVLNEIGLRNINAQESYKIKLIEATVYDALGNEIKKFKRKDFKTVSLSEGSGITDNKVTYLDYTPVQYPFTVIFECDSEDSNTAFIPQWYPIDETLVSVQRSIFNITYPSDLGFKYKECNFEGINIKKQEKTNGLSFTAENLPALRSESNSPPFNKLVPHVFFGLEKFHLEGVDGDATNWENFSSWNYNNLLKGTDELTPETQAKVIALVGDEKDPIKKAKMIYTYVQNKTRYVSIQLGLGGWKPMAAKEVDRLGYGDCKALTNYTRALLKVVGVPSYYAVVYGASEKKDLQADFVSMQGNHVILAIPHDNKLTWLECTSQTVPFGYEGKFTDDRMALLIKPEGGQLVRTTMYAGKESKQMSKGNFAIDENGTVLGAIQIRSTGIQYDNRDVLERKSADELKMFYKDYFSNIGNLKLNKITLSNDKENVEFVENVSIEATSYATLNNNRIIFLVNAFNQISNLPQRYRNRKNPVEISRGFYDYDEITINLPQGYSVEAKPENVTLADKFGDYKSEFVMINAQQMLYKRTLNVNEGQYANSEYENYRKFMEQVSKNDKSKMVLVKN